MLRIPLIFPDWLRDRLEQWRLEGGHTVARRITQLEEERRLEN